jgi:hypothetical protein
MPHERGTNPFTSANATSLTVPDTASLMKGGLTPLTSANAISLTIPDQLQEKHMEGGLTPLTWNTFILRQNVTFIKPLEHTLGHATLTNPTLNDPITLNPGQRVIIDGRQWILRDRPTITETIPTNPETTTKDQHTQTSWFYSTDQQMQTSPINLSLNLSPISPAEFGQSSDESVATYYKCYIPPELNESNAESVDREKEIQRRIKKQKQEKELPERPRPNPAQRSRLRDTWLPINIEPIPPHLTSLTVEEGGILAVPPTTRFPGRHRQSLSRLTLMEAAHDLIRK